MQTATRLTAAEAAKETGVSKSTILRALESGKLSGTKEHDTGRWFVEPVELFRVFPAACSDAEAPHAARHDMQRTAANPDDAPTHEPMHADASADATRGSSASYVERLKTELEGLKRAAVAQREERERERNQLEGTISDYRSRLDRAEEKRDEAVSRLTAVLTDQREPAKLAPVPVKTGLFAFLRRASA